MDMKKQESQRLGFTLIELLVVIAIIGLLAAIIVPSINGAFRTAKKARAMQHCKDLQGACQRYFAEYNRMPVPKGTTHGDGDKSWGDDNRDVVDILVLADDLKDPEIVNPRSIRFLDMDAKTLEEYGDKGVFRDPWGTPYEIFLDLDFDDTIEVSGTDAFKAKVGVRSAGPDGKWDTDPKDDIKTW